MSDASPLLDASGTSGGIPALSTSAKVAIILRRHIWAVAWKVASDVLRPIDIGGLKRFASDDIKELIEARLISQVVSKKAKKACRTTTRNSPPSASFAGGRAAFSCPPQTRRRSDGTGIFMSDEMVAFWRPETALDIAKIIKCPPGAFDHLGHE